MRCTVRGERMTCSASSRSAVRVYCSIASVSRPRRTRNCPVWAESTAGTASAAIGSVDRMPLMAVSSWRESCSFHSNRFHFVVLRNLVDHVEPLRDLSENGVDSVQVRLGGMTDEELAAAGVLSGVGHGQRPRHVLVDVLVGLALDGVAWPTCADAPLPGLRIGVASLNHEVGDHAVELGAVVERRVRELLEIGDGARHFVGEQLHVDSALRGLENGLFVRHHHSRERFSSTCATVFIPTITTDTASLSSTKRSASCAGVTPAWPARSFTRSATAMSCAT